MSDDKHGRAFNAKSDSKIIWVREWKLYSENLDFFIKNNFFIFLNRFNIIISKIIFKNKKILF
jgi:hypothetical protein